MATDREGKMDLYEEIVRMRQAGRSAALATITAAAAAPSFTTAKMLVRDDGSTVGTIGGGAVEAEVIVAAARVIASERAQTLTFDADRASGTEAGLACGGAIEVFLEPVIPAPILYLFGAGHVGAGVFRIARQIGFEVTVIDDRPELATPARFPEARDILAGDWESSLSRLPPPDDAYIFSATRTHQSDFDIVRWAMRSKARYVGMIGSGRKVAGLRALLEKDGVPPEALNRLHAPVGLDIGAVTPDEIAVAVVAEMIAVRRGREEIIR